MRPPQPFSLSATALSPFTPATRPPCYASKLPGCLCLRLLSQLPSAWNAPNPVSARLTLLLFKSLLRCYFSRTPTRPDSSSGSRLPCPTRVAHPQHSQPTYPPFWGDWLVFCFVFFCCNVYRLLTNSVTYLFVMFIFSPPTRM